MTEYRVLRKAATAQARLLKMASIAPFTPLQNACWGNSPRASNRRAPAIAVPTFHFPTLRFHMSKRLEEMPWSAEGLPVRYRRNAHAEDDSQTERGGKHHSPHATGATELGLRF
jgi:hypothetical protein